MKKTGVTSLATVVLVLSCIAVAMVTSDPITRPQISTRVATSSLFQPPSIWSPVINISLSDGVQDAACDVNGHAHILFRDSSDNLYHVEHDGATFSTYHLIGALKNTAAICVVGTTVHVAWVSMNGRVQYTRRVGGTWELNHTLPGSLDADDVAIAASGSQVWALWKDTGPRHFVLAKGTGTSWTSETIVNNVADDYNTGTILYRNGRLHVAWVNGNSVYYRCYSGEDVVINDLVNSSAALFANPRIALSSTDVYLAYVTQAITNCSYTSRSFVNTIDTWSTPINFARGNIYVYQMECEIAYTDGVLYFTWRSYRTTPSSRAQSHYITFNGTWSSMENLTAGGSSMPQLATSFEGVVLAVSHYPSPVVGLRYKYFPLSIAPHDDIEYTKGSMGNLISWRVMGRLFASGNYQVFNDGGLIMSATWTNGSFINILLDGLDIGVHNYTIAAADGASNKASGTVFVTVVEPEPDMSGLIAAIVIPCAIGGGLLVLFVLDKKKVIDLKKIFGKSKRHPSA